MNEQPLFLTSIRLYLNDVEELERIYGRGWSGYVREIIHRYLRERRSKVNYGVADEHD